jgi:hypothetical protein
MLTLTALLLLIRQLPAAAAAEPAKPATIRTQPGRTRLSETREARIPYGGIVCGNTARAALPHPPKTATTKECAYSRPPDLPSRARAARATEFLSLS